MPVNDDDATVDVLLRQAEKRLAEAGVTSPRRNAEWLLCEALGLGRAGLMARMTDPVPDKAAGRFEAMLERRLGHEPLQYVLGYTEFFGLRLDVSPEVLIPRPETEQVVEEGVRLLAEASAPLVLDVGTGSGCIALAIKAQRADASVWACDVSESALAVAAHNAEANGLEVRLFSADALAADFRTTAPSGLDLLVSNPPYVSEEEATSLPREVVDFEPHLALFSWEDPLRFYARLGEAGLDLIRPGGHILFETHAEFGDAASRMLDDLGYGEVVLMPDYSGRQRILRATRPNSRA